MIFVDNQNITDPHLNLAIEEYLLREVPSSGPILFFYINEPSVIIGRNQNTVEEIDSDYIKAHNIHVVRRLSGGGAVYHDFGNLNFSFITNGLADLHNFAKFTTPMIDILDTLGIEAELRGRSDIYANGKKISGNAQYSAKGRMFSHGTLLFDTRIDHMLKALNPKQVAIESKAVQSVRQFVTNIRDLLADDMDIYQFRQAILDQIFGAMAVPTRDLSEADWIRIEAIADERYRQWSWNYGRSPQFNVSKKKELSTGKIDVRILVDHARIQQIRFYGNFEGLHSITELEMRLIGVPYESDALTKALLGVDISQYIQGIDLDGLIDLLY